MLNENYLNQSVSFTTENGKYELRVTNFIDAHTARVQVSHWNFEGVLLSLMPIKMNEGELLDAGFKI